MRIYRAPSGRYWLAFSFRTMFLAPLRLHLCHGAAAGCSSHAEVAADDIIEFTPEALVSEEFRKMQAFKNFNIVGFPDQETALLVEFSLNPRQPPLSLSLSLSL